MVTHAPPRETAPSPAAADPDQAPNGWSWAVLRGFREGERGALTAVYRMYAAVMARFLRGGFSFQSGARHHRFVGYRSSFELHDALHETFRRAFEPRARESYDGLRPYGPYLRTIARNVVLKTFRAREVLFPELDDGALAGAAPIGVTLDLPTPERVVHDAQLRRLVRGFLDELDAADRELITLRFSEGKSQRDVAALLGLGRQRVRGREVKLRARLLAYLRAHGEGGLVPGAGSLWPISALLGAELARALTEVVR